MQLSPFDFVGWPHKNKNIHLALFCALLALLLVSQTAAASQQVLFAWGNNSYGDLCIGDIENSYIYDPKQVSFVPEEPSTYDPYPNEGSFRSFSYGADIAHFVDPSSKYVFSCGRNNGNILGTQTGSTVESRFRLPTVQAWPLVAGEIAFSEAGGSFQFFATGTDVWSWGLNDFYQTGQPPQGVIEFPVRITPDLVPSDIRPYCGPNHCIGLNVNLVPARVWGLNDKGQLGIGKEDQFVSSIEVDFGLGPVKQVALGPHVSFLLLSDNTVYSAGDPIFSGRDDTPQTPANLFSRVPDLANICSLSAGTTHNLALTCDGVLYGWGQNYLKELYITDQIYYQYPTNTLLDTYFQTKRILEVHAYGESTAIYLEDKNIYVLGFNAQAPTGKRNGSPVLKMETTAAVSIEGIMPTTGGVRKIFVKTEVSAPPSPSPVPIALVPQEAPISNPITAPQSPPVVPPMSAPTATPQVIPSPTPFEGSAPGPVGSSPQVTPSALPVAPVPIQAVPQCQGNPPSVDFECIEGVWATNGSISSSTTVVVSSQTSINGSLIIAPNATILFTGLDGFITVSGCLELNGSIVIELTQAELDLIASQPGSRRLDLISSSANCPATPSQKIDVSAPRSCKGVKAESKTQSTNNRRLLSSVFDVNTSKCNRWWIILVSVLGGVVLLTAVVLLVLKFKPKMESRQYTRQNSRLTNS